MKTLKFSRKKHSALLLFFFSLKVRVAMAFTAETPGLHPSLHEGMGRTYGRFGHKQIGCIDNQILLPMVLRCALFARARSPFQNEAQVVFKFLIRLQWNL